MPVRRINKMRQLAGPSQGFCRLAVCPWQISSPLTAAHVQQLSPGILFRHAKDQAEYDDVSTLAS